MSSLKKSLVNVNLNYEYSCEISSENAFTLYFRLSSNNNGLKKQTNNALDNNGQAKSYNAEIISYVAAISQEIRLKMANIVINVIPAYHTLFVVFDPLNTRFSQCQGLVEKVILQFNVEANKILPNNSHQQGESADNGLSKTIELPVFYDENVGIDLVHIAKHTKLSIQDIINLHQQPTYQVNAIGFAPGFAYMGDVDSKIAMPRLATPRLSVPKGAVAIADNNTAVYPAESPGGWNIIGRCPITLFDPNKTPVMNLYVGAKVRFKAIDKVTFLELGGVF